MDRFQGKTAVITGGASGIGRALADRFAAERMNVVLADIEEDALAAAVKEMEDLQHSVMGIVTDTMRRQSIEELLDKTVAQFGNVHILCNNAGIAAGNPRRLGVWDLPDSDWEWTLGVNFYGVLYGIQVFVPHMLEHGESAHIVNTASLAGVLPGGGPYGVSKHAVLSLTEGLKGDLLGHQANISASVLCPGFVATNIADAERNRPSDMGSPAATGEAAGVVRDLLANGKAPAEVADIVFEAIQQDRFYVLPHPGWDDTVRNRVEAILSREGLPSLDMEVLIKRRIVGEDI